MLVANGLYTRKVATFVASLFKYLTEHPEDTRFYELEIVHSPPGKPTVDETVFVRLIDRSVAERVVTLANGREIVRFVTKEGKRLDVLFGHEEERHLEPAIVFYESEDSR